MTTATRSCIRYVVVLHAMSKDWFIGEADDRDGAEEIRDGHANRNRRPISDYAIEVKLREEAQ